MNATKCDSYSIIGLVNLTLGVEVLYNSLTVYE
jgi:hypothetical protein